MLASEHLGIIFSHLFIFNNHHAIQIDYDQHANQHIIYKTLTWVI